MLWYTARGAGLSALVLLTVTTGLGVLATRPDDAGRRVVRQYLHRACAALGLGVLVLHVATILADSYAHIGVTGAIVPFTAGYRATWVGLGTIAAYLLLIVAATGAARGRLAGRPRAAAWWRPVHALAYLAWPVAMLHGFLSGTDSDLTWVRLIYLGCLAAVLTATLVRITAPAGRTPTVGRHSPVRNTERVPVVAR